MPAKKADGKSMNLHLLNKHGLNTVFLGVPRAQKRGAGFPLYPRPKAWDAAAIPNARYLQTSQLYKYRIRLLPRIVQSRQLSKVDDSLLTILAT